MPTREGRRNGPAYHVAVALQSADQFQLAHLHVARVGQQSVHGCDEPPLERFWREAPSLGLDPVCGHKDVLGRGAHLAGERAQPARQTEHPERGERCKAALAATRQ